MTEDVTIFVVDDDPAARKSLCALVKSRGLAVRDFSAGEEFIQAYNPEFAGVLITDLRMGGISGIDLQERLTERGSHLPVIFVSGHADVPATVRLMENGAVTLLQKPYLEHDLLGAIDRALQKSTQAGDLSRRLRDTATRLATLSVDEERIMQCMLEGKANKVIARELDTSMRTVDRRRRSVFDKLGVESVAELVRAVSEYRHAQIRPVSDKYRVILGK